MKYMVIIDGTSDGLSDAITYYLSIGWQLQGGVSASQDVIGGHDDSRGEWINSERDMTYAQALIKPD